jgi:predicted permease
VLQQGASEPVQIESAPVSHDFFRVLGVSPVLGRDFASSDERVGAPPVVILSDRIWRDRFGADPRIIGQMIRLNGSGVTVIGVTGPGVEFPRGAGLWIPLGVDSRIVERRGATFLQAIARTKPGVSRVLIANQVNGLFRRLAADHPEAYTRSQQGVVTPMVEYWTGSARIHLWIMLCASILLFFASTIGGGNLLLSRTLARRTEIATRLALGAQRKDILAQLGGEGAIVAIIAGLAALCVAQAAILFLLRWAPADIPRLSDATLHFESFCFAAGAAMLAAIGCTVIPAWSSLSRRGGIARNAFIVAQAALTVVLLSVAGLLMLSYRSMMSTDAGFANRDALSMNLQLRGPGLLAASSGTQGFDLKTRRAFYTRLLKSLRESPGVTSAAAVLLRPLEGAIGWDVTYEFAFEAGVRDNRVLPKANFEVVTPDYFRTVGTALLEGRDFNDRDNEDAEPVVILSRTLAERIRAAGHTPLGYRVRLGTNADRWSKVVGVSADARYRSITQPGADMFVPYLQALPPTNYVVIRGTLPARDLAALVRHKLSELDSSQAVAGVATIGELIDSNSARHRFNMILLSWFGLCAAILAAAGVYSVIAESMAARTREIAIRTALGSPRIRLVRDMVIRPLGFVLLGESLGAGAVFALGTLLSELLYGVSPRDSLVAGSVLALLFVVSAGAAVWPAWSAAGHDPKPSLARTD